MSRFSSTRILALISLFWLVVLSCRTSDVIAQANPTATRTVTRTVPRPTFTSVPPTNVPTDTPLPLPPQPTGTLVVPVPAPTARPIPRSPTPSKSATPAPPPPTADPYAGFYFKPRNISCVASSGKDTRIQGSVYFDGNLQDNVHVRISAVEGAPPALPDFITGTNPNNNVANDPLWHGKFRLGISEGAWIQGTWFVWIINPDDNSAVSPYVRFATDAGSGCNIGNVDFVH